MRSLNRAYEKHSIKMKFSNIMKQMLLCNFKAFTHDFMSLLSLATKVADKYSQKKLNIVSAESCTGGQIGYLLTSIAGSSCWYERGFITYSNEAKQSLLDVPANILENFGAVSEETALAMIRGALANSLADVAVATTGIAGPGGGSAEKPVGTVWIACGRKDHLPKAYKFIFEGDRQAVRDAASKKALEYLLLAVE